MSQFSKKNLLICLNYYIINLFAFHMFRAEAAELFEIKFTKEPAVHMAYVLK